MTRQRERSPDQEQGRDGSLRIRSAEKERRSSAGSFLVFSSKARAQGSTQGARAVAHKRTHLAGAREARGKWDRGRWHRATLAGQREPRPPAEGRWDPRDRCAAGLPAPSSRHPAPWVSPTPRLPSQSEGKGSGEEDPASSSDPDWLPQLFIQNLFLMEGGVPPSLPQITFATSSQPVGPKSAGQKRLGASELGPTVPCTGAPRPGPRWYILPSRPPPLRGSGAAASL